MDLWVKIQKIRLEIKCGFFLLFHFAQFMYIVILKVKYFIVFLANFNNRGGLDAAEFREIPSVKRELKYGDGVQPS